MSQYIYLLQEREFIKTKENIYKVGMTEKENHKRFNQYPKGSILLCQLICDNCKNIEKIVLKLFKQNFKQRKDIGNEYFEGDYKIMIDIIYSTIKNEKEGCENDNLTEDEEEEGCENNKLTEEENSVYQIKTYEDFIKFNEISEIIITNKKGEGLLRFKGQLWRKFYDKTRLDFDEDNMEYLLGFLEKNQPELMKMVRPNNTLVSWREMMNLIHKYQNKVTKEIINWDEYRKLDEIEKDHYSYSSKQDEYTFIDVEYDNNSIIQDIIKKYYLKSFDLYDLKYYEYVFPKSNTSSSVEYVILDCLNFTFTNVDDLINNKILTEKDSGERHICVKDIVNVDIVDSILNSLLSTEIKLQYKKLVYNLFVRQEEHQLLFYDYNECLLTTWITDTLYSISNTKFYTNSCDYYENKTEFKKLLKTKRIRCVIIREYQKKQIKTQINDFRELGFRNIIVCQNDKTNSMYNISNFRKYLRDNKEILMKCIKEENNYEPISSWESDIQHDDNIFYKSQLLLTNFLKWCCIKY
jgi:hypothetical protein